MPKNALVTDMAPGAIGPYSQGIKVGNFVFTSGQLPINPADGSMPEDVQDQARIALANVNAVLEAAGAKISDIVKVTVFLDDIADFKAVNEVYAEFFVDATPYPARSAVQAAALPKPGAKLEIEAIAVMND
ncbi:MAG: RidA family protein [Gammaproteobacteria bacterium]|nr:RidA family protein [Gammaproteobacteria bacterium]